MYTADIPSDHLHDESRLTGRADAITFPRTTQEVQDALREAAGRPVTVQGARTGISGGAVPDGGLIISLSRMNRILTAPGSVASGRHTVTVQPGVLLTELHEWLETRNQRLQPGGSRLFFPPDPTEISASIGGMTACNASGARSFAFGPTRNHIGGLTAVLADGDSITLRRGEHRAVEGRFTLETDSGRVITGSLPAYRTPDVKCASGYAIRPEMDLIDLFIGSEGTLAIVTEIEILLSAAPPAISGVICFFDCENKALQFVEQLRSGVSRGVHTEPGCSDCRTTDARLLAIEYFDDGALSLIRRSTELTGILLPETRKHRDVAVYAEWAHSEGGRREPLALTAAILGKCGGSPGDTWLACDNPGQARMKAFRHAVPEQVNAIISERKKNCPSLTKLGTDLSVPDCKLKDAMHLYRSTLHNAGLEYVIFGHIGDNHLHVNIIPRDMEDYRTGRALYGQWAEQVAAWGGAVSAEHGIGRLKKELLKVMYGQANIEAMKALKTLFDPAHVLNPGRLFD